MRLKLFFSLVLLWLGFGFQTVVQAAEIATPIRQIRPEQLQQPVILTGTWQLMGPDGLDILTQLPGAWEKEYPQKHLPHFGKGIYQLKLQLPAQAVGQYFKLYTNLVAGETFRCYINGQLVGHNGIKLGSRSRALQFSPFKVESTTLDLRIEVTNTQVHYSGLVRPLLVGEANVIDRMQFREHLIYNLMIGVFLFLGLLHLLLFMGYREDKSLLWCALLCIGLGGFGEFSQIRNLEYLFGDIPIEVTVRMVRLSMHLAFTAFFWYSFYIAPKNQLKPYLSKRFLKGITWLNLIFVALMVLPLPVFTPWLTLYVLIYNACLLYNLYQMLGLIGVKGSFVFFWINIIFCLNFFHDMLLGLGLIQAPQVSRYGMLIFSLSLCGLLAWRLKSSFHQAIQLQRELQEVNQNLDGLVSERTQEVRLQNEELQQLVNLKDEMTQMIMHDLKVPLNSLLRLPAQQMGLSENQRSSFEAASQRMILLVENLVHVRHVDRPGAELRKSSQSLAAMTSRVLQSVSPWAQGKKIQLHHQIDAEQMAEVDGLLFERVLLNLLDNALKYTPIGGCIRLSCQAQNDQIYYWIDDSGPGIPQNLLEAIFDRHQSFARGSIPRSSGLGLHFCRQVIEAHGGNITLSNLPQGGTRVEILLLGSKELALISFNSEQQALLKPIFEQLARHEVYDISNIQTILKPLLNNLDPEIQSWKHEMNKALREVDELAYASLLNYLK